MKRLMHAWLAVFMLVGLVGVHPATAAQADDFLDLADVPLPIQSLPEAGYQVLSGGYLAPADTARLIGDPRNLDAETILQDIDELDVTHAYVLDLVLPEDRAWQDSPILAIVQTSVYVLTDESSSDEFAGLLQNYANTSFVNEIDPAVDGAYTIEMVGGSGDQLRTVVSDGRITLEIVSMDATGAPDETEHILIVEATIERLERLREYGDVGLSSMALTLQPGETTANFGHTQQTGVHGIYRFRDDAIQPAIGELDAESVVPSGMTSQYVGSGATFVGGGTGLISVWLGAFETEGFAQSFFELLVSSTPAGMLTDPYFAISGDETWAEQGVLGVYRVTGDFNGQPYSGSVEVRLQGDVIVAIGYRTVGATLPDANIASSIMDHQLVCLEARQICAPFDLATAIPAPQATPVVSSSVLGSSQFGWSLPELGPEWIVDEQFSEAGYDRMALRNGASIVELESVINYHGEPVQCVLDELHLLEEFEEHSVITVWEDANGNTDGGNTQNQAWITYRVEPLAEERADQEYVIRIDCFTLQPGNANLVVHHIAPVDVWVEEQQKGAIIRDAITLPEFSAQHGKLVVSAHDRRTAMIIFHDDNHAA